MICEEIGEPLKKRQPRTPLVARSPRMTERLAISKAFSRSKKTTRDVIRQVVVLLFVWYAKRDGWRSPICHFRRARTRRSVILERQLSEEMGLMAPGSLGLGIGWMVAVFQEAGSVPVARETLKSARRATLPR